MNWLVALLGFGCARLLCLHIHKQRPNIRKNSRPFGCCRLRIFVYLSPGLPIQAGGAALQYRARFSVRVVGCLQGFVFCMSTDFPITLDTKVLSAFSLPFFGRGVAGRSGSRRDQLAVCGSVSVPVPQSGRVQTATESARPSLCRICDCTAVLASKRFSFLAFRIQLATHL